MHDNSTLVSDAEPGYVLSKNDWIIDVPGEPEVSWFRRDGWAEVSSAKAALMTVLVLVLVLSSTLVLHYV